MWYVIFQCYQNSGGWKIDLAKGLRTGSWFGWGIYTPSNETAKINGESMLIEKHTKSGQLGVEQWSGVSASFLLHSSQQDFSVLSSIAAETEEGKPVNIKTHVIKTVMEIILGSFIFYK